MSPEALLVCRHVRRLQWQADEIEQADRRYAAKGQQQ